VAYKTNTLAALDIASLAITQSPNEIIANCQMYTVKPALVTTSIKQHLVLGDLIFYFPSQ
jgi:hypothetical protein